MVGYSPFEELTNVIWEEPSDWDSLTDTTKRFLGKIKPGDWLVVDMISPCREWAIETIVEKIYGEDMDVLMARKMVEQMTSKKLDSTAKVNMGQMLLDIVPWKVVSKRYNPWAVSLISHPGHLIIIAGQKEIYSREKGAAKDQFSDIGLKPDAEGHTGHLTNDNLLFRAPKPGEPPRINTVGIGGRGGRPMFEGEAVPNFALAMVKKWGWKL